VNVFEIDPETDVLLVIDVQPTFMPGGGLPVDGGDEVLGPVNELLEAFQHAVATQDWHGRGHSSFASSHPGKRPMDVIRLAYGDQVLWGDHGVAGTPEAELHQDLRQDRVEMVVRKGFRPEIDSYSAFFENDRSTSTGLAGYLRERGFRRVFVCGLALDFCVAFSAEDASRLGFETYVVQDACRGVGIPTAPGRTTIDDARDRLAGMGVSFIAVADVVAHHPAPR
jgi:nicotinamidase/pyrazinamidase